MKKIYYSILPISILLAIASCESDENIGYEQSDAGVNFRMIAEQTQINLLATDAKVNVTAFSENTNIEKVTILVELNQGGNLTPRNVLKELNGTEVKNDGSTKLSFTLTELSSAVGLTVGDLAGSDAFTIYNVVKLNNGLIFPDTVLLKDEKGAQEIVNLGNVFTGGATTSYTLQITFTLVCPSDIKTGDYSARSTGTSTDGCPPTNPLTDYAYDVTIKKVSDTEYEISDIFAGVYINWYGACYGYTVETPANFADICNTLAIGFSDGFGAAVEGTGTYDPGTGIITYTWTNQFGDTATTTLTPK